VHSSGSSTPSNNLNLPRLPGPVTGPIRQPQKPLTTPPKDQNLAAPAHRRLARHKTESPTDPQTGSNIPDTALQVGIACFRVSCAYIGKQAGRALGDHLIGKSQ